MRLGEFEFNHPVCSAPMAGVTDKAFRLLAREQDCDLVWTEMISATALTYNNARTRQILDISGEQQPVVVQIFGSDPAVMAKAAKLAEEEGARIIDINMGCPAPKIVKNSEGSALLKDIPLAQRVASATVEAVKVPVTVKIRLGWAASSLVGAELAQALEGVGVAALTVHARTREQFYAGKADWNAITEIKNRVSIPVIGNGDIRDPEDARAMLALTGCDGVMIGRGSLGNPWIFARTTHLLHTGELLPEPLPAARISMALRHLSLLTKIKGEKAVQEMRKHVAWYTKGLRDAAKMRDAIMKTQSSAEMSQVLLQYGQSLGLENA